VKLYPVNDARAGYSYLPRLQAQPAEIARPPPVPELRSLDPSKPRLGTICLDDQARLRHRTFPNGFCYSRGNLAAREAAPASYVELY
jgi:hypothetical protein